MSKEFTFSIKSTRFDEDYRPSDNTRITTNFANLARGERREENLRSTLRMIDNRFNAMAHWDNPNGDRYALELDIISVEMDVEAGGIGKGIPMIEILKTSSVEREVNDSIEWMDGNDLYSYVREYDFSVLLREHNEGKAECSAPGDFGDLHRKLFKSLVNSAAC